MLSKTRLRPFPGLKAAENRADGRDLWVALAEVREDGAERARAHADLHRLARHAVPLGQRHLAPVRAGRRVLKGGLVDEQRRVRGRLGLPPRRMTRMKSWMLHLQVAVSTSWLLLLERDKVLPLPPRALACCWDIRNRAPSHPQPPLL